MSVFLEACSIPCKTTRKNNMITPRDTCGKPLTCQKWCEENACTHTNTKPTFPNWLASTRVFQLRHENDKNDNTASLKHLSVGRPHGCSWYELCLTMPNVFMSASFHTPHACSAHTCIPHYCSQSKCCKTIRKNQHDNFKNGIGKDRGLFTRPHLFGLRKMDIFWGGHAIHLCVSLLVKWREKPPT